MKFTSSN